VTWPTGLCCDVAKGVLLWRGHVRLFQRRRVCCCSATSAGGWGGWGPDRRYWKETNRVPVLLRTLIPPHKHAHFGPYSQWRIVRYKIRNITFGDEQHTTKFFVIKRRQYAYVTNCQRHGSREYWALRFVGVPRKLCVLCVLRRAPPGQVVRFEGAGSEYVSRSWSSSGYGIVRAARGAGGHRARLAYPLSPSVCCVTRPNSTLAGSLSTPCHRTHPQPTPPTQSASPHISFARMDVADLSLIARLPTRKRLRDRTVGRHHERVDAAARVARFRLLELWLWFRGGRQSHSARGRGDIASFSNFFSLASSSFVGRHPRTRTRNEAV
jgi:hypothetical protein